MQVAFYQSESEQPHPGRARAIIKAHPEVRELTIQGGKISCKRNGDNRLGKIRLGGVQKQTG